MGSSRTAEDCRPVAGETWRAKEKVRHGLEVRGSVGYTVHYIDRHGRETSCWCTTWVSWVQANGARVELNP